MANPHVEFQASHKPFESEPEEEELRKFLEKLTSKCEDSEDEAPNLLPSNTPSTQNRRKRRSKLRRSQKRQRRAQEEGVGVPHIHRTFLSQKEIASLPTREIKLRIRLKDLPFGKRCYVGSPYKQSHGSAKDAKYHLKNAYEEIQWDGQEDVLLLDADDYIIAVLAGCPAAKEWPGVIQGAEEVLAQAWTFANDTQVQSALDQCKARGTHAITTGFAYGGGRTKPGNKALKPNEQDIVDVLIQNKNIERIANFQSNALGKYAPKIWKTFHTEFNKFYERYDGFQRPFTRSVYPQLTFNLGGRTVSFLHRDNGNTTAGLCPITSLGSYNYKKGGHLVLPDLRVIIQFPPGTTILIPSALLIHGNTTISPDETRLSITSYSSGGLLRWIQGGFQSGKFVDRIAKGGAQREAMLDKLWGNHEDRLAVMSTRATKLALEGFYRPLPADLDDRTPAEEQAEYCLHLRKEEDFFGQIIHPLVVLLSATTGKDSGLRFKDVFTKLAGTLLVLLIERIPCMETSTSAIDSWREVLTAHAERLFISTRDSYVPGPTAAGASILGRTSLLYVFVRELGVRLHWGDPEKDETEIGTEIGKIFHTFEGPRMAEVLLIRNCKLHRLKYHITL